MAEYEHSLTVNAPPDTIFDFVQDVTNLPKYLPTTKQAEAQGSERVRVKGEANGHPYDADGYFRANDTRRRLEWGSDGENGYSGWLEVSTTEGAGMPASDDASRALVTVHLSYTPRRETRERMEEASGGPDQAVQQSLEASLQSIKNFAEHKGGKVEPPAATG